ncbi:antibiotic biosynthesis monooxygenase [Bacillus carboniphilus]|uniref:Antibiotic biosynthesis monooxygenase n=1 Tax=Bacillus carboniphilus TaxID=86663 RepID=A0ABY9JTY8_9BACI|nr:antibiotic biosynthesis monooxygenase [Bacillus carboniphilus]WLR42850.1 antibiotic biosynthesis monooxygenase [Bacillus carboniphilus]
MNYYITYGTADYLEKVKRDHPNLPMQLMENEHTAMIMYESEQASIFNEPKRYEVIDSSGIIEEKGRFAVLNNIPVTIEGKPLFEKRFKDRARLIEKEPGFVAIRVLRPINSDTYVILTLWESEEAFENWQSSKAYNHAHKKRGTSDGIDQQSIFPRPSYVTKFHLIEEE